MKRLFAAYLGGRRPGTSIEAHDVAFVAAERIEDALPALAKAWGEGGAKAHLDSWADLSEVDGHRVALSQRATRVGGGPRLYFVNIGSSTKGRFGENHRFHFLVCASPAEARRRALAAAAADEGGRHADQLADVDDVVPVVAPGLGLRLTPDPRARALPLTENVYWPLGKPRK